MLVSFTQRNSILTHSLTYHIHLAKLQKPHYRCSVAGKKKGSYVKGIWANSQFMISLKCNYCWNEVEGTAFVTRCQHCFCKADGEATFSQSQSLVCKFLYRWHFGKSYYVVGTPAQCKQGVVSTKPMRREISASGNRNGEVELLVECCYLLVLVLLLLLLLLLRRSFELLPMWTVWPAGAHLV